MAKRTLITVGLSAMLAIPMLAVGQGTSITPGASSGMGSSGSGSSGRMEQHVQQAMSQGQIREAQMELKEAGFYRGTIDGMLGKQTTEAIREYQRFRGLPETGKLDEPTKELLMTQTSGGPGSGTTRPGDPGSGGTGSGSTMPGSPGSGGSGSGTTRPGDPGSGGTGSGSTMPGGPGSGGSGSGTTRPGDPGSGGTGSGPTMPGGPGSTAAAAPVVWDRVVPVPAAAPAALVQAGKSLDLKQ